MTTTNTLPTAPRGADATPSGERVLLLDVVRGMALLGILVMNMPAFTEPGPQGVGDPVMNHLAEVLRDMLFAGKFNSIFSMLFGLGFMLQLGRLEARLPERATAIYVRRLSFLLGLGMIHVVWFFGGDVLHMYALLGFGLLWLRRWPDKALIALMVACLIAPALSQLLRGLMSATGAVRPTMAAASEAWNAAEIQAWGHGSLLDTMRQNVQTFVTMYTDPHELRRHLGFFAQILTTMVLGLLIGRHRYLYRLPELMPRIVLIQRCALALGVVCTVIYGLGHDLAETAGASLLQALVGSCYVLARLGLMGFYVLTVVRALQHAHWQRWLAPFAAAGRMPLTNYLLQTAMCSVLFYGWGFALWDKVGATGELLLAPALFLGIQLPLSVWWLGRFGQGPFEALWRRATYGRDLPPAPAIPAPPTK